MEVWGRRFINEPESIPVYKLKSASTIASAPNIGGFRIGHIGHS